MPIIIKEWSWHQTSTTLNLNIVCPVYFATKNVDVFVSDKYVKVSHPPYILELFFEDSITVSETRCLIQGTSIDFEFFKEEEKLWKDLKTFNFELNSSSRKQLRSEAVTWRQNYEADLARKALVAERERERLGISNSIEADEKTRRWIADRKEQIRQDFEADLAKGVAEFWGQKETGRESNPEPEETEPSTGLDGDGKSHVKNTPRKGSKTKKTGPYSSELARKVAAEKVSISGLAPPRSFGSISFDLTPRQFSAPVRESKTDEEEQWVKKRADIFRKSCRDENGEELMDVESVLRKGEEAFKLADFQSAYNIYTFGIEKVSSEYPAFYSNRSACCLKLENYEKAVEDSSKALDFLQPAVEANAAARAKAMIRRGSAFAELGLLSEAIIEFEAASRLMPNKKEEILKNAERIKLMDTQ